MRWRQVRPAARIAPDRLPAAILILFCLSAAAPSAAPAEQGNEPAKQPTVELIARLEGPGNVVRFSGDGKKIVTAGKRWARAWDGQKYNPLTPLLDHGAEVTAVEFDEAGERVLTVSEQFVRVWDASSGKPVSPRLRHGADSTIDSAVLSPDGQRILTVAAEPRDPRPGIHFRGVNAPMPETTLERRSVHIWDRVTGEMILSLEHASFVRYAGFSPDGKRILTVCATLNGAAFLWDAANGRQVAEVGEDVITGNPAGAFSRDGKRFALTGWYQVTVHSAGDGKQIAKIDDFGHEHEDLPTGVVLSPDGNTVLAASQLHDVRAWDVATGRRVGEELHPMKDIDGVEFGPNAAQAFVLGYDFAGAGLWNVREGKPIWAVPKHSSKVTAARFEPDGSIRIACGSGDAGKIYKLVR